MYQENKLHRVQKWVVIENTKEKLHEDGLKMALYVHKLKKKKDLIIIISFKFCNTFFFKIDSVLSQIMS